MHTRALFVGIVSGGRTAWISSLGLSDAEVLLRSFEEASLDEVLPFRLSSPR